VLERLHICDFAVARDVTIEPVPGLNVFTGETGAGKSLVVDALAFVFGARRSRDIIATGRERAVVKAIVSVGGQRKTVERTMPATGRSTARIDGAPASLEDLVTLGNGLVDIHGQAEQLSILRPVAQLAALDAFAGLEGQRDAIASTVRALRDTRRHLRELSASGHERERLLDQLRFESAEIAAAALVPGEDHTLHGERARLGNVARLIEDCAAALQSLESGGISEAVSAATDLARRDPTAVEVAGLAGVLETAAIDFTRALRSYRESLEEDPERLAAVEERLDTIARLKRKYGATLDEVLAYGQQASARLQLLESSEGRISELQAREQELRARAAAQAAELSRARRAAAASLCASLAQELSSLGMVGARLAIGFACEDDGAGLEVAFPDFDVIDADVTAALDGCGERHSRAFTESGVDRVEFLASFNPGEVPRSLATVASGGETSRFLLALTAVLGAAAPAGIVVFDEVDEGVGGRAGSLVGSALARLATRHQVLCVTHLPQVAAFGEAHFVVGKQSDHQGASSTVRIVEGPERVDELAAMLGGITEATRQAARELLASADTPTQRQSQSPLSRGSRGRGRG
jgi:DNA repair protein RecN (Recombination protein N)